MVVSVVSVPNENALRFGYSATRISAGNMSDTNEAALTKRMWEAFRQSQQSEQQTLN